jgi:predicted GTPase
MKIGAGIVAAKRFGAAEIVDPRPYAVGKLAETYKIYPNIGTLLPAMGYGEQQIADLAATIRKVDCDSVVIGTPIDLSRVIPIDKPYTRVAYSLQEIGHPDIEDVLADFISRIKK